MREGRRKKAKREEQGGGARDGRKGKGEREEGGKRRRGGKEEDEGEEGSEKCNDHFSFKSLHLLEHIFPRMERELSMLGFKVFLVFAQFMPHIFCLIDLFVECLA